MTRPALIRLDTVVLVLLAICAWKSNPDEDHFRRYLGRQMSSGNASLLERMASHATAKVMMSAMEVDRTNYGFFSIARLGPPFEPRPIIGAFGLWFAIPTDRQPAATGAGSQSNDSSRVR